MGGPSKVFTRGLKTLFTTIHDAKSLTTRQHLLHNIQLLDRALNEATHNKTLLFESKYNHRPLLLSSKDTIRLENAMREFVESLQLTQGYNQHLQLDSKQKLGKIGLELFMECHKGKISPIASALSLGLISIYNRHPSKQTLEAITSSVRKARDFIKANKVNLTSREEIDSLVDSLSLSLVDSVAVKKVLATLDYKPFSMDTVRVLRGKKMQDEIEVSKGWKFPVGVSSASESYLRSLDLPVKKLVSTEKAIVLLWDGPVYESRKILPTLHYASREDKPVLLISTGEVSSEALSVISIHNNKSRRNGAVSRVVLLRYNERDHNGLPLHQNIALASFLGLPKGCESIYFSDYSESIPSKASGADYYGSLESLKATTGECFLYNSLQAEKLGDSQHSTTTITLNVGGSSELEIDQRRASLDVIINDILSHGLASGFVPSHSISIAKCAGLVSTDGLNSAISDTFSRPMQSMLSNMNGLAPFHAAGLVARTVQETKFCIASMPTGETDLIKAGLLEPWQTLDEILANVLDFVRLLAGCNVVVSRICETPKSRDKQKA
ncbi:HFL256Wp [Eremothecium sinecaudum]|uniref:HFL256Wp n=1 Tax=Eremothecium sinecaudum TaxID=45286 RepID=A0A120K2I2_9SACH|nr:HFL256Wp [Eremothecium sinecaudum]AMD21600.1 HFL256Wp [Eremothecium sinecaudum]